MKIEWGRSFGWNMEFNGFKQAPEGYQWVKIRDMEPTEIITDGADCYPWREVYAWLPVKTIAGRYVWRKKVFKRKVWVVWGTGFHMEPEVQYATVFDMMDDPYANLGR